MRLQTDRSMEGRKNGKSEEWKDGSSNEVEVCDGPSHYIEGSRMRKTRPRIMSA